MGMPLQTTYTQIHKSKWLEIAFITFVFFVCTFMDSYKEKINSNIEETYKDLETDTRH